MAEKERKEKLYGSIKRFGVRYGVKHKAKVGRIEAERRASTKCPYCRYSKAKRLATGIWHCRKCKSRFTAKAYTIGGPVAIKAAVETPVTEVTEAATAERREEAYGRVQML